MTATDQSKILAQLQGILDNSITRGVPDVSAAIRISGQDDLSLVAGQPDIVSKEGMNEKTAFGIGSITKVFVAIVTLQLIEEKKLNLNDEAKAILKSDILDEVPFAKNAKIKDLLSHTGGIASWEDDPQWIRDGRGETIKPKKIWEKHETLAYVRHPRHEGEGPQPGKYSYANTNYTILGMIIEKLTNNTAEAEIRRRILQPLNMEDTYLEGFEQPEKDCTPSRYHWLTKTFQETAGISPHFKIVRDDLIDVSGTNLSVSWTAGGMISTPADLLKLASGLQDGSLLSAESMAILMDWQPADEGKDIGHGIFRLRDVDLSGTWIGHNGGVLGFTAAFWFSVDGSCAVAILSNVGASHAGEVPSSAAIIANGTEFLKLAGQLAQH